MTPERWEAVKRLFNDALERQPSERAAYVAEAAKTDPALAEEVRALLSGQGRADEAFSALTRTGGLKALTARTRLGPYEIVALIGAGGMGEVYKARDTRLDRTVAVKVLPADVAADPGLRTRFEREARTISSLSHPHICALYDVGEQDGRSFLVMEYLEGDTLTDRLAKGPLPLDQALRHATEIAEALAEAHQHGVVHRDLKPGNVMLTEKGAKLLDFGIAKLRPGVVSEDAPTATASALTGEGLIVGTPQYMAPEQLEGKAVDARSDIFAFGVVVYEMVTGRRAFEAPSRAGLIAAILEREPVPLRAVQPLAPAWLERLVGRCLAKRPTDRWRSSVDLLAGLAEGIGGEAPAGPLRARRVRTALGIGAAVVTLLVGVTGLLAVRARSRPVLTERDTILLADFLNTTGDGVFDDALKHALALHLEQSPFLGIVPDQQVRETLQFMKRSSDERVSGEIAREVCQRRGIKALLTGSIQRLGTRYVVDLTAANCQTGDTLVREQATAATREEILPAIGGAASRLRRKLGESLGSIERYDVPIEQVTTSSFDALKAFTLGEQQRMKGGDREAVAFYKRAIDLDPDFALAYHRVALMYRTAGETQLDAQYAREAFARRHKVSERERLHIEARYYFSVTGELQKVLETHRVLAATYARDWSAANNLGVNLAQIGRHREALEARLEALRRAPDNPLVRTNVGWTNLRLNRFEEAQKYFGEVVARGQRVADARRGLYLIAFLRADRPAMEQQREAGRGPLLLRTEARVSAFRGAWREAQGLYRRAVESAAAETRESAAQIAAERAVIAAFFGHQREAAQKARSAAAMSRNPHAIWSAAVALTLSGAPAEAQKLIDDLASEYPLHTLVQNVGLSSARAALELRRGRASAALAQLAPAEPYELGEWPWIGPACLSIYLKGQAHLVLGAGAEAAAEFQKIIDHRGLNAGSPLWSLAHLGLGRAHAAAGDVDRARQAYEDFLGMWKDADPDVPVLREARDENARLAKRP